MSKLEVIVTLVDGISTVYELDASTTLTQLREMLKEDEFIQGDEIFLNTQNAIIPKSQEKVKTIAYLKVGEVAKITLSKKNQQGQNPQGITPCRTNSSESTGQPYRDRSDNSIIDLETTISELEDVDVMNLGNNEIADLLNRCSYLYGRNIISKTKVAVAHKRFFKDVPENRDFSKSSIGTTGSGIIEKRILTHDREEQDLFSQGYCGGSLELGVQLVGSIKMSLAGSKSSRQDCKVQTEYLYFERNFTKATFALSEIRSVVSDEVKNFFKPNEKVTIEKIIQFFDIFGAIIPERITVGGKYFHTKERTFTEKAIDETKKLDGGVALGWAYKFLQANKSFNKGKQEESKSSDFHNKDQSLSQCFGGDIRLKDRPDEWVKSLNKKYTTWQIVSIESWKWSYEYLDEPLRSQIKPMVDFYARTTIKKEYKDKGVYEGEVLLDKREGKGKMKFANGDVYEGEWKNDRQEGHGMLIFNDEDKRVYEGNFHYGKMHGKGKMTLKSNGSCYQGDFADNQYHGQGKLIFNDQDKGVYEGSFENGKIQGKGKMVYHSNGSSYEGDFVDNYYHGRGKLIFNNEAKGVYEGSFHYGRMHGKGKMVYHSNGSSYEGDFVDDQYHGQGKLIFNDKTKGVYEGSFENGKIQGKGKMVYHSNGSSYEGDFADNHYHGYGTLISGKGPKGFLSGQFYMNKFMK